MGAPMSAGRECDLQSGGLFMGALMSAGRECDLKIL